MKQNFMNEVIIHIVNMNTISGALICQAAQILTDSLPLG